jgi:DNA modification methylase
MIYRTNRLFDWPLKILAGDCREVLPTIEAQSVQTCVTSPPYWGLRDYGTAEWQGADPECDHLEINGYRQDGGRVQIDGFHGSSKTNLAEKPYRNLCGKCGARRIDQQLGLEATPQEYIASMVAVFREVWRVLRDDGTLWLNLGDSYATSNPVGRRDDKYKFDSLDGSFTLNVRESSGLKSKDLCMMPARVAMALQADGWYLRSDIIWHKPNPMPESVTDRPTKSHEYIFLLTKQERYFYDVEAIREPSIDPESLNGRRERNPDKFSKFDPDPNGQARIRTGFSKIPDGTRFEYRNKRSVWTIATQPYAEAHFATFPEEIPKLCILAGTKPGDIVLDPFMGSGTTLAVALGLGRKGLGIELNAEYIELALERTNVTLGMF